MKESKQFKVTSNMDKKLIICYFLLMGSICVTARKRKVIKLHKTPLYRSLEPDITSTEAEVEMPKVPTKSKLFAIKPRNYDENDEGRFLKHILLYKSFMQPETNRPAYMMPYFIINNTANSNNVNNNSANTAPPAGVTAPTVTGTGGTGAGGAGGGNVRIVYVRDSQALPYALPMPMPTQIYQQRQQHIPQIVYGFLPGEVNQNKRRRNRYGNTNANADEYIFQNSNTRKTNPFSTFANSLRRVQFL